MRLKQIQIYNFGQFSQETVDLPEGNLADTFWLQFEKYQLSLF